MSLYIDPATLEGQPLILKAMAPDDFGVRVLDRLAGRIMAKSLSGGRVVWFWTVTGPYIPSHLQPSHGDAESLEEAKAAFRAKFDAWLAWAKDLQHPVVWSVGPAKSYGIIARMAAAASLALPCVQPTNISPATGLRGPPFRQVSATFAASSSTTAMTASAPLRYPSPNSRM